jgi:hypothetical protein
MCVIKENSHVKIISFEFQIRQCVCLPYPKLEGAFVDTKFGSIQNVCNIHTIIEQFILIVKPDLN